MKQRSAQVAVTLELALWMLVIVSLYAGLSSFGVFEAPGLSDFGGQLFSGAYFATISLVFAGVLAYTLLVTRRRARKARRDEMREAR